MVNFFVRNDEFSQPDDNRRANRHSQKRQRVPPAPPSAVDVAGMVNESPDLM